MDIIRINTLSAKHPLPPNITFSYGTAGFRLRASDLDSVTFRTGILAALRSKTYLDPTANTIGAMITASHNPPADNGLKICEPMASMLDSQWEEYAILLANASDLALAIQDIITKERIDMCIPSKVIVARDTRPSGIALTHAFKDGVEALNGELIDFQVKTTPQLHYLTRCLNTMGTIESYGEPTEDGYCSKLSTAYKTIIDGKSKLSPLYVDAANGVGALALENLKLFLGSELSVNIVNGDTNSSEKLNFQCGADFVKIGQKKPQDFDMKIGDRCASFDGDADRIVFYFMDQNNKFVLLDGDKIAILAAGFIMRLVKEANIRFPDSSNVRVGLVQTAYANGSSTLYAKEILKIPVVFTCTGVKYLHHAAEEFDVGVYFEANGHGTVLFSKRCIQLFRNSVGSDAKQREALRVLGSFVDLINQTVGDSLSDLLMVEAILTYDQLSFEDWNNSYSDLPSKQEKVKVSDRTLFVPINADTELSAPVGLQGKINAVVKKFTKGRCFVRPSGTEDVVRVYAEAATVKETEELSGIVCGIVFDSYGGVGNRPDHFVKS